MLFVGFVVDFVVDVDISLNKTLSPCWWLVLSPRLAHLIVFVVVVVIVVVVVVVVIFVVVLMLLFL